MKISGFLGVFITLLYVAGIQQLYAQMPATEIWMADFKGVFKKPSLLSLTHLTGFNPGSYNNQPFFYDYNEVYLSSATGDSEKTDIYTLNVKDKTMRRVTDTPAISEFSPTPRQSFQSFSCVRIEENGIDQSLWLYPLDRSHKGKRLLQGLNNVGYHTWLDDENVALFLVAEPNTLVVAHTSVQSVETISENIGRCLKSNSDGHMYFVHKESPSQWTLKKYDTRSKSLTSVIKMPYQSEDFDIMPQGIIITSKGPKIYIYNPLKNSDWQLLYNFEEFGILNIERPVIMRERIVFVENKG
jgi:hypothetical protein